VTSCATRISNVRVTEADLKPTGRILIYDRLEFVTFHLREVGIVNVLLKLRIGPGVCDQEEEVLRGQGSTHVMLTLPKLNRVPSSSQFPGAARFKLTTRRNIESGWLCHL
jgi:hypothetical protein